MLTVVGGLYIKQRIEVLELVTSFETENKYDVFLTGADCVRGSNQQPYFFARESSDCFQRQCCGNMRGFTMNISSPDNQVVMKLERPFKCQGWLCRGLVRRSVLLLLHSGAAHL